MGEEVGGGLGRLPGIESINPEVQKQVLRFAALTQDDGFFFDTVFEFRFDFNRMICCALSGRLRPRRALAWKAAHRDE